MNKTLTSHGGDIYTEGLLKGKELIDYSSNINLLGVPSSFYEGIKEATNLINYYPDIQYRSTKEAIIKYHKISIDNDNIILGNGAAEVLDLAISTLKSICIIAPSFSEYEISAKKYGLEIIYESKSKTNTWNSMNEVPREEHTTIIIANKIGAHLWEMNSIGRFTCFDKEYWDFTWEDVKRVSSSDCKWSYVYDLL